MVSLSLTEFKDESFTILFTDELSQEIAEKISSKITNTINQAVIGQKSQSSAIIPHMELNLVTFAYIFKYLNSLFGLTFTINSENQLRLYKCIPLLEKCSSDFIASLESEKIAISDLSTDSVKGKFSKLKNSSDEFLKPVTEDQIAKLSIKNLIQLIGPGISSFYRALLLNDKTVIFATKDTEILDYPWKELVPHKTLDIKAWPEDPASENEFDIMIVTPDRKKECDAECVILDLGKGKVEQGKNDKYLESFFNYLKTINDSDLALEINLEVNNIFKWMNDIIEACTTEKNDEKIKEIINFHTKSKYGDRLPLLTSLARKYNEYASERISAYFLKELGIFKDDVKRIDSKKFLSKL